MFSLLDILLILFSILPLLSATIVAIINQLVELGFEQSSDDALLAVIYVTFGSLPITMALFHVKILRDAVDVLNGGRSSSTHSANFFEDEDCGEQSPLKDPSWMGKEMRSQPSDNGLKVANYNAQPNLNHMLWSMAFVHHVIMVMLFCVSMFPSLLLSSQQLSTGFKTLVTCVSSIVLIVAIARAHITFTYWEREAKKCNSCNDN